MNKYQVTDFCHHFVAQHVKPGDVVVDATVGNGHDTLFLCELVGPSGKVYGFDIQEEALTNTATRLKAHHCQAQLIHDGHECMADYIQEAPSAIVFNLGYLPKGNHLIATQADTTLAALRTGLSLLQPGGIISLCIYSGGETGFNEREAVLAFLKNLDSRQYLVIVSDYYNRPNNPPLPALIIKL